jgi:hypothetical protein
VNQSSYSCLVSFLCCNLFISGTDYGTGAGVLFVWVRIVGLFVSFVLIYLSQALIITCVARVLDCEGFIFIYS